MPKSVLPDFAKHDRAMARLRKYEQRFVLSPDRFKGGSALPTLVWTTIHFTAEIRLSKDASNRLRFLAGRTGLTPNLLCRMGFCLSLEEPKIPKPADFPEEDREFNRYTLLGEYDVLFMSLLRQRMHDDHLGDDELEDYFRAHLNRGIALLQQRVRSVADLASLVPLASRRPGKPAHR